MPLEFPTEAKIREITWAASTAVAVHESTTTFKSQVYRWPGQRLGFHAKLAPMRREQAQAVHAWLLRLNGQEKTFYFTDTKVSEAILGRALPGGKVDNNPQEFTAASGVLTAAAHGYAEGTRLRVSSTGTLPDGLTDATDYYARDVTTDTFKISLHLGTGATFTVDTVASTVLITSSAHGKRNGDVIYLFSSNSDLPAGLSANTPYYVISRTTDTFQISLTSGGAAVAMSDDGSGTLTWNTTPLVETTDAGTGTHSVEKRQFGEFLNSDGWKANTLRLFKAGDWIGIDDRLRKVVTTVDSDATGGATLELWPRMEIAPEDDTEIKINSEARGVFRMAQLPPWTYDVTRLCSGLEFSAVEAL